MTGKGETLEALGYRQISVRVADDDWLRLRAIARLENKSYSECVREGIALWIAKFQAEMKGGK